MTDDLVVAQAEASEARARLARLQQLWDEAQAALYGREVYAPCANGYPMAEVVRWAHVWHKEVPAEHLGLTLLFDPEWDTITYYIHGADHIEPVRKALQEAHKC